MKIGILGGMGPLATADFFKKIVLMTEAKSDQEHLRVLMDDNPQIPDRTAFIMGEGKDPTRAMVRSALRLEYMGADFIAMPCNTAHRFHAVIQSFLDIPVLNMIELVGAYVKETWPRKKRVLLLATKGTYTAGIYNFVMESRGIELIIPDTDAQETLMNWIYDLKTSGAVPEQNIVLEYLHRLTGGESMPIILGCTELPVIVDTLKLDGEFVDTTTVLAKSCVEMGKADKFEVTKPITA